jgi:putative SOS response-associated peptidase YedK
MCARFALDFAGALPASLARSLTSPWLEALRAALSLAPPREVRPTDAAPVIHGPVGEPVAECLAWGLIPRWARDPTIARHTFNARAETVAVKPAFRDAFRKRRCVVPVSRWIEWTGPAGARVPVAIEPPEGLGGFAGLWDEWVAPDGERRRTFTVLTCTPVPALAAIHDRMPLLLAPADWSAWVECRDGAGPPPPMEGPFRIHGSRSD